MERDRERKGGRERWYLLSENFISSIHTHTHTRPPLLRKRNIVRDDREYSLSVICRGYFDRAENSTREREPRARARRFCKTESGVVRAAQTRDIEPRASRPKTFSVAPRRRAAARLRKVSQIYRGASEPRSSFLLYYYYYYFYRASNASSERLKSPRIDAK